MTDREIRERRAELKKLHDVIWQDWQAYDARYPVEVGAYKPPDYDRQQLRFVERLQEVSRELSDMPSTKAAKFGWFVSILAVLGGLAWVLLRFVF